MTQRGVSPVVGMVMLVGLVAVVSVGLLVVGAAVADSTTDAAETKQVESSMSQFAETADAVASGQARSGQFQIGSANAGGTGWADGDAGQIEIVLSRNATGETTLMNSSLGVYRYQLGDGTEIAYQGGGVWRLDGGHPTMITPPDFEYRASPVPTLTFPHVRVGGDAADSGSIQGELSVADERSQYPINDSLSNPLEGEYLYVDIESRYCEGWERHIDQRTEAAFDERCGSDQRLRANMSVGELTGSEASVRNPDGAIDGAIVGKNVDTNDWNHNGRVDGDIVYSDSVTPTTGSDDPDDVIENGDVRQVTGPDEPFPLDDFEDALDDHVANGSGQWEPFDSTRTYDGPDTHYIEDVELSPGQFHINATEHEQTIVIRDDLDLSGMNAVLDVDGEKDVRIFVGDSVEFDGNPPRLSPIFPAFESGNEDDPSSLTVVAGNDFRLTGNTPFYGVVVVPSGEGVVESNGATLDGALIAQDARLETGEVVYNASGWQVEGPGESGETNSSVTTSSDLYYLHVSETVLDVDA